MSDNTLDITMDQGDSTSRPITLTYEDGFPFLLAGYDARLQVRRTYGSPIVLINCTLQNGKLSIASNIVTLNLIPSDTSSILFNSREDEELDCVYDLEITSPSGFVTKPIRGQFILLREVTR